MHKLFTVLALSFVLSSRLLPPTACLTNIHSFFSCTRAVVVEPQCVYSAMNCRRRWSERYSL